MDVIIFNYDVKLQFVNLGKLQFVYLGEIFYLLVFEIDQGIDGEVFFGFLLVINKCFFLFLKRGIKINEFFLSFLFIRNFNLLVFSVFFCYFVFVYYCL